MKTRFTISLLAVAFMVFSGALFAQNGVLQVPSAAHDGAHDHAAPVTEAPRAGGGTFTFEEETHNFGELEQGGNATWVFKFTNTGTEAITISLAKGSCGCTVPTWPKEAIQPGGQGQIEVKYDSNRIGLIDKFVTIISDANETEKKIFIKGNIVAKPAAPTFGAPVMGAPANGAPSPGY